MLHTWAGFSEMTRTFRRRTCSLTAALAVSLLALSGCGGASSESENSSTFTMALPGEIASFHPYTSRSFGNLSSLAYDSLVNLAPDGEIVTGLAEDWQVTAKGAIFTLRSGITCSDGTELTASQVAKSLRWVGDPANQAWFYGALTPPTAYRVTADDAAGTVAVKLDSPFGFLLQTLGSSVPIVCDGGLKNPESLTTESNGTGPFVLDSVSGDAYTFTKHEGYEWGPDGASTADEGTPDELVFKVVPSETTAASLLQSGDLNAALVGGPDFKRLEAAGLEHAETSTLIGQVQFNVREGRVTADEVVRRALTQAVNLDELTNVQTGGRGSRATSLLSENPAICPGDVTSGLPDYDQRAAERALDDAGWVRIGGGARSKNGTSLVVDLHYPTAAVGSKAAAEFLAARWKEIGVETKLSGDNNSALQQAIFKTSDFDVYMAGQQSNLPSTLMPFVSGAEPPTGFNIPGAHNTDYDRLAAEALTKPGKESCGLWNEAAEALVDDLVLVPYASNPTTIFTSGATLELTGLRLPSPTSIKLNDD